MNDTELKSILVDLLRQIAPDTEPATLQADDHIRVCLNIDQQVAITIAGLAAVEARVAWVPGHSRGCAFERALHVAVFDHLVGQYRKDC